MQTDKGKTEKPNLGDESELRHGEVDENKHVSDVTRQNLIKGKSSVRCYRKNHVMQHKLYLLQHTDSGNMFQLIFNLTVLGGNRLFTPFTLFTLFTLFSKVWPQVQLLMR